MEQSETHFPGIPFRLGRETYVIPSLSASQFRKHEALLSTRPDHAKPFADFIVERIPAIGDAIRRNYPDLTDEQLMDLVDLGNFSDLLRAVQAASGMKPAPAGE